MPRRVWGDPVEEEAARWEDLASRVAALERRAAGLTPEAWHNVGAAGEVAFGSGWSNFDSNHGAFRFRREGWDLVRIEGTLLQAVGTNGTVAVTLPVGYRPIRTVQRSIRVDKANAAFSMINILGTVTGGTAGQMQVYFDGPSGAVAGGGGAVASFGFTYAIT